ncbi:MAG TPA: S8 family serine peptidase [Gemmatimonadaceae bacterium]|nr:S8 family serine peptidase [Gemmatimonadaceae bacterium]
MHQLPLQGLVRIGAFCILPVIAACADLATSPAPSALVPRPAASVSSGTPTGKTVVVFTDTAAIPDAGLELIASVGGVVTERWDDIGVAFVTGLSVDALTSLDASDLVAAVGNDRILSWLPGVRAYGAVEGEASLDTRKEPWTARFYADGTQWGMRVIGADKAWAAGHQGTPATRVAIIDTGIDYDHRELKGLVDHSASTSFAHLIVAEDGVEASVPVEPQYPGDHPYMDNHFHGTHVAATVASNNISVAAVSPRVTVIAVKVLSFTGSGTFESVASGIRHAAGAANADVINMSLGANVEPGEEGVPALLELMRRVISQAEKQGTIVISAAGNSSLNLDEGTIVSTPCEQSSICVSATGPLMQQNFDQAATYTNYGITAIEVAAPGGNASDDGNYVTKDLIISACSRRSSAATLNVCRTNTDGVVYFYAYAAGTSMASPHVAGEAALIKSADPLISVNGIRAKILHSADDVQDSGRDIFTNWGRINAAKALGL